MQTRTQLLWELGVVMLVLAEGARQFFAKLSWLPPAFLFVAVTLIVISWIYQYWHISHPVKIASIQIAVDTDEKVPKLWVFITFLSKNDTSLSRVIKLDWSKKIMKGISPIFSINPYFWLGREHTEHYLSLEAGKAESFKDQRDLFPLVKSTNKIKKAIDLLRQGIKDGEYSVRYNNLENETYIYRGKKRGTEWLLP